jgi:1-deoxy-D-xylulose-5-phosphate reductoisomerase
MAGSHVMNLACENGTDIIPVDSEHSAVFSLLSHLGLGELERIILTASGGALRNMPVDRLSSVSPEMALAHPTWSMGSKITIDSATLMNKGLEVIEAHHLFNLPYDKIDVIIHPESVVHSMVETIDGVSYAHMGVTDMAVPIAAAFSHPVKRKNPFGRLNLTETGSLTFSAVDRSRYPSLDICYGAGRAGGVMPAVLNAANEIAVGQFLDGKILFTEIVRVVEKTMALFNHHGSFSMDDIFSVDAEARIIAKEITGVK